MDLTFQATSPVSPKYYRSLPALLADLVGIAVGGAIAEVYKLLLWALVRVGYSITCKGWRDSSPYS